jgi:hypothetical protein
VLACGATLVPTGGRAAPPPAADEAPEPLAPIAANRTWDRLTPDEDARVMLAQAGEALGAWTVQLAGIDLDGERLGALAALRPEEPILRVVREELRQAVDLTDLLYFLDDVLVAGEAGRRGEAFFVGAGRARSAGILIHPDDVFKNKPRVYPHGKTTLAVDEPLPQEAFEPAEDGALLGPEWTMRFRNPTEPEEMYRTLAEKRPSSGFASRVASLVWQLEQQGADVYLTSFLRWPQRGYLMWGASELRRCDGKACVDATVAKLDDRNQSWKLGIDIRWAHPDGWKATQEAARQMADAYDVVYATEKGARYSNHYDGVAADFVAIGLPAELHLIAPDGEAKTFDLSDPQQPRDLSLTPELIAWVETHFGMGKLKGDYPHWNDAKR